MRFFTFILSCALLLPLSTVAGAAESALLKGKVLDLEGKRVPGVKLFLYDSANARRAADFISVQSDLGGSIGITVPPGTYWVVAREKKEQGYGPLARGDRHSGEPAVLELAAGKELEYEFVVADIQEVRDRKRLASHDSIRIKGRILDQKGAPVPNAYVYGRERKEDAGVPMFLSAWSDEDGSYQLDLPAGAGFFVAASRKFPPETGVVPYHELPPQSGKQDRALDVALPSE